MQKDIEIDRFLTELFQQQKGGRFLRHSVGLYLCYIAGLYAIFYDEVC